MGEQQHQIAQLVPLVVGRGQELVDDHLRAVDEVTELRLPHDERLGCCDGVAILEAHCSELAEQRVVDVHRSLIRVQHLQRRVRLFGVVVHENRMPMAEGAALRVLTGEPDAGPFERQRSPCKRLGETPVDDAVAAELLVTLLEEPNQLGVHREACRQMRQLRLELVEPGGIDSRVERCLGSQHLTEGSLGSLRSFAWVSARACSMRLRNDSSTASPSSMVMSPLLTRRSM